MNKVNTNAFGAHYSSSEFWAKGKRFARAAGRELLTKALQLYYAACRKDCPAAARATVFGALGYFIFPFDLVPDAIPGVGYGDDLIALSAALKIIHEHIDSGVKRKAAAKVREWLK